MQCPADLKLLLRKYDHAESREEIYIKRTLEGIAQLLSVSVPDEYYYADLITRDFCRVIDMMEKQSKKEKTAEENRCRYDRFLTSDRVSRFSCGWELTQAFYNHFKDQGQVDYLDIDKALAEGRKDLVNPTMKDYAARISTFANRYLEEMVAPEAMGQMDPVVFTYENIEWILATFKTRDNNGGIVKQRVNIRSALRKLNEFKQFVEQNR